MSLLLKVDIDGVLRDWNHSLIRVYKQAHPNAKVQYPFADWNISPFFPKEPNIDAFYRSVPYAEDVYLNAEPYKGAIDFIEELVRIYPNVWLVSTQFPFTTHPTIGWVEKNIPSAHNLPIVFSKDKGSIGRGKFVETVLIDDAPHNLKSEFEAGGIAVGFGQSYNYGKIDFCVNFFGSLNFKEEHESDRVAKQFQMILKFLATL
jgi:5'(3')-deoxyribonucleotidase